LGLVQIPDFATLIKKGGAVRITKHVLALLTIVAITACGAPQADVSTSIQSKGRLVAREDVIPVKNKLLFGRDYRFEDGVTVSVSTPKSFQPSTTAYPQSERAVAFEIVIKNDSLQPYRLSGLSIVATVEGTIVKQVVDSVQGFSGIIGADRSILSSRSVRMSLAFAAPAEPAEMQLSLRPDSSSPDTALYCGSA